MPATALRHPDEEEFVLPVSPPGSPSPSPVSSPSDPQNPDHHSDPHSLEWRSVAPYVDHFTGAEPAVDRVAQRRRSRRHKPFILSSPFLAGMLVFVELMGLVSIYAVELKAMRQEDALTKQIKQTNLQIALSKNEQASYKSSPLLAQWAAQLGYRKLQPEDFDDVTSNAPMPAPRSEVPLP